MKNPRRDVLLSMTIGLVLLFFVQSILGIGMTNYVSLDILANDPAGTPHMTYATNLLGNASAAYEQSPLNPPICSNVGAFAA